jgi:hypothetical protein
MYLSSDRLMTGGIMKRFHSTGIVCPIYLIIALPQPNMSSVMVHLPPAYPSRE